MEQDGSSKGLSPWAIKLLLGVGVSVAGIVLLGWYLENQENEDDRTQEDEQDEKDFAALPCRQDEFIKLQTIASQSTDQRQKMSALYLLLRMWPTQPWCAEEVYIQLLTQLCSFYVKVDEHERAVPALKRLIKIGAETTKATLDAPSLANEKEFLDAVDKLALLTRSLSLVKGRSREAKAKAIENLEMLADRLSFLDGCLSDDLDVVETQRKRLRSMQAGIMDQLCEILVALQEWNEGIEVGERALQGLLHTNLDATMTLTLRMRLLRAYLQVGRNDDADATMQEILKSVPNEQPDIMNLLGKMNHTAKRFEVAENLFRQSLQHAGQTGARTWKQINLYAQNLSDLASIAQSQKDWQKSKQLFQEMRNVTNQAMLSAPEVTTVYFRDIAAALSFKEDARPFFMIKVDLYNSLKEPVHITAEVQNADNVSGKPIVLEANIPEDEKQTIMETQSFKFVVRGHYRIRVTLRSMVGNILDCQNILVRSPVDTSSIRNMEDVSRIAEEVHKEDTEMMERIRSDDLWTPESTVDVDPMADGQFEILENSYF